jgi:hypothetical protein
VLAVGAALGGGFENMSELKVIKFEQAMESGDKVQWGQLQKS